MIVLNFDLAGQECKVKTTVDKFKDVKFLTADFVEWARFTKVISGNDTAYFLHLWAEATTSNYGKKGCIILLSDGTKIEKPEANIDCKFRVGTMFDYTTDIKLTKEEVDLLSKKWITAFQLYIAERSWGEKKGTKIKETLVCLIEAK